jgi:hypothetical protein
MVSDALQVAKAEPLRVVLQEVVSASDGTSADLEGRLLTMQRRLMAAVPKDSAILRPEK